MVVCLSSLVPRLRSGISASKKKVITEVEACLSSHDSQIQNLGWDNGSTDIRFVFSCVIDTWALLYCNISETDAQLNSSVYTTHINPCQYIVLSANALHFRCYNLGSLRKVKRAKNNNTRKKLKRGLKLRIPNRLYLYCAVQRQTPSSIYEYPQPSQAFPCRTYNLHLSFSVSADRETPALPSSAADISPPMTGGPALVAGVNG